jgi:hypothetical protein
MKFRILFGVPEMQELWERLSVGAEKEILDEGDMQLFKRLSKAVALLEVNPKYPGLHSHAIEPLSRRYGMKVWQSYLQNNTPAAGRIFWVYAPEQAKITIIGLEPHPELKTRGYDIVRLSSLPKKNTNSP